MERYTGFYGEAILFDKVKKKLDSFGYRPAQTKKRALFQGISGLMEKKKTRNIEVMAKTNIFEAGQYVQFPCEGIKSFLVASANDIPVNVFEPNGLRIITIELE